MKRLGLIPCLGALLALPGCIVTYGLGETAEESSGGSGDGSGTDGTSAGTDPNPDPSATSGQPPGTTTDPSDTATGPTPPDSPDTETDGDTEGEPGDCEPDPDYTQWLFNGTNFTPLAGVHPAFVAILTGDCEVGEIVEAVPEVGAPVWTVPLDCSLAGRIDGDAEVAGQFQIGLEMTSTVGYELVSSFGQEVRLKLVLDWWGMGWNGWLVLEDPNTGDQLLDLANAEYVDPQESTWGRQVGDVMPGPWRENLSVGVVDDECGGAIDKCGGEARAVAMGIGPDYQQVLHAGQEGTMNHEAVSLLYRASVTSATATPEPMCTDMPLASYAFAIWMQSQ